MSKPVEMVVVGAGQRGTFAYGTYAIEHPDELRIVAVAEPNFDKRLRFAEMHNLPKESCFQSWEDLLSSGQLGRAALITTQDQMHVDPAVTAMRQGYDVLLEKPMAVTPGDCMQLVQASESYGKLLTICHVLRYTKSFSKIHEIVTSGRLGDVIAIEHRENLDSNHMAHSFVRGNWNNVATSCPMILAKCCHDLDILTWNMTGQRVKSVQSMGSLKHFRPENAPVGATKRCTDGCPAEENCVYYAPRFYLDPERTGSLVSTISVDSSREGRLKALQTGPYGRCVYFCDNDVVDHQIVNLEFEGGTTATLIMQGFSHEEGRTMRYDGTRATLRATIPLFSEPQIVIYDHLTGKVEQIGADIVPEGGHGGGDVGVMSAFLHALRSPKAEVLSSARVSLESHLLAFAAEEARLSQLTVQMNDFRHSVECSLL